MRGVTPAIDEMLIAVLKRDRIMVMCALAAVILVSWAYVLAGAGMGMSAIEMTRMGLSGNSGSSMPESGSMTAMMNPAVWNLGYALLMFVMWWIMMNAMMLPSAAPMILLYASVTRKQAMDGATRVPTALFAFGYIAAWGAFSLLATGLQWGLDSSGLLTSAMASNSVPLSGCLLVAAGLWQLTPMKKACLTHCRSPLSFILNRWRPGGVGAVRMGAEHGAFCLGCCWFLMGLLFVGGVMNLYWIGGLAVYVLLEKTIPAGHWLGTAMGVLLAGWGVWALIGTL